MCKQAVSLKTFGPLQKCASVQNPALETCGPQLLHIVVNRSVTSQARSMVCVINHYYVYKFLNILFFFSLQTPPLALYSWSHYVRTNIVSFLSPTKCTDWNSCFLPLGSSATSRPLYCWGSSSVHRLKKRPLRYCDSFCRSVYPLPSIYRTCYLRIPVSTPSLSHSSVIASYCGMPVVSAQ